MESCIAIICDEYLEYRKVLVDAIAAENAQNGFGTLCVCGRELNPRRGFHQDFSLGNDIYKSLSDSSVKGIVCLSGAVGHNVPGNTLTEFLHLFSTPMVSLGLKVPGL